MKYVIGCLLAWSVMFGASVPSVSGETVVDLNEKEIYLAFFDLPDGEATLIKGLDETILINTGPSRSEEALLEDLNDLNITSINSLILTKQSADYCQNAERLIDKYKIKAVIHSGGLSKTCEKQVSSVPKEVWAEGKEYSYPNGVCFKVLKTDKTGEMSMEILFGNNTLLYLSNSGIEDEDELLQYNPDPQMVKIGDYARGKSPSSFMLDRIDPHLAIIFNSEKGNPNEGLIERLNESWIDVYQLEQVGTTIIRLNEKDYEVLKMT
ncbi:hypothetical protein [Sediminibacillus massiliensis]|uniref:hypothetical protein n=1 Tax=Sediminibacillus massiliensis TaxID=1926277 RepID=UPI0009884DD6|nr:hypothetical protein [Sediminibacillus massiliensis]